jgi:alpha-tubulin suppressor-like RCC1 family protein
VNNLVCLVIHSVRKFSLRSQFSLVCLALLKLSLLTLSPVFSGCTLEYKIGAIDEASTLPAVLTQKIYLDSVQITMSEGSVAIINVALSDYLKNDLLVNLSLNDPDRRFQAVPSSLLIPSGVLSRQVILESIDDSIYQGNQTIKLTISTNENSVTADPDTLTINLVDNEIDDDVDIAINDVTVSETTGNAIFTVSLSKPSIHNVEVSWATANGTALAGTNFTSSSGTAIILSGATATTVSIPITDSPELCAGSRIFYVNLSSPVHGVILDNQGVGTIQENDFPTLSISAATNVQEGMMADPIVSLSQACSADITVDYSTIDSTAIGFLDYFPLSNRQLTISAGTTSMRAPVTIFNDTITESSESFFVTISNPSLGSLNLASSTATVTILDNDPMRTTATDIAQVKAGLYHTCILTNGGTVKCWGRNDYGQLGLGFASVLEEIPAVVNFGSSVVTSLSVGGKYAFGSFNCAVASGSAKCWGFNSSGQLGNSSNVTSYLPVSVTGLAVGVTEIATGGTFACALVDGGVKCWGSNGYGQLGNGTTVSSNSPVDVSGLGAGSGVLSISAGSETACAILAGGGTIKCWGRNDYGQLGDNSQTNSSVPVDVSTIAAGASKVSNATYHTCALVSGGIKCWGANGYGQLGNGNNVAQLTPVDVTGMTTNVLDVSVGGDDNQGNPYSCGVDTSGAIKCWGTNLGGVMFGPSSPGSANTPFANSAVPGGAVQVSITTYYICAKVTSGTGFGASCWGQDFNGNFARVGSAANLKPFDTLFTANVSQFSIGGYGSSCVVVNGAAKCFGSNSYGQLGNSTFVTSYTPVVVTGMTSNVSKIVVSGNGSGGDGQVHTCAITTGGALKCWGANSLGQVGDNTATHRSAPVTIFANGVQDVEVAFGNHTCAIMITGALKCWGRNDYGQLGNGLTAHSYVPADVTGLTSGVTQVAASKVHTCAIVNGGVKCWGSNGHGELGLGTTGASILTPQDVPGLSSGVTSISAAGLATSSRTCVVQYGAVKCWGSGYLGGLGNGSSADLYSPTTVIGLGGGLGNGMVKVVVNELHTCALSASGALKCWGANWNGEVGVGNTTLYYTPMDVLGMQAGILDFDLGSSSTCVLALGNSMKCWGNNIGGALGLGYSYMTSSPVDILFP